MHYLLGCRSISRQEEYQIIRCQLCGRVSLCVCVIHGIMGRRFQVRPGLDSKYTSSTTPGQQIRVIGCRVAVPHSHWSAVPTPLFIYIPVVEGLIFCISATPHLGTSFPLFHGVISQSRVQPGMDGGTNNK